MSTRNKNEPSVDGSREVWGAFAREPTVSAEGLHPLGPPERPLDRIAAPSHATALTPVATSLTGTNGLASAAPARALAPSRIELCFRGPGRMPRCPGEGSLVALIVPWLVRGSASGV